MKVKYANRFIVCANHASSEVTLGFYRQDPVLDPVSAAVTDTSITTVSRLIMSRSSAEILLDALTRALSDKTEEESE